MLYAKGRLDNGDKVIIPIEDNIFNFCPKCGKEVYVSLSWFFEYEEDENGNLLNPDIDYRTTEYYCQECSKKHIDRLHIAMPYEREE